MIRSAFGFTVNRHRSSETSSSSSPLHNVLFVRREDYLAHPRHDGKVQPLLINEEEVFESLHHWVASGSTGLTKCGINLVNGLFAHVSMKDQVRAIQDASVIIGAHGAGLTHIVSATPNTTIFEIVSVESPNFSLQSKRSGCFRAFNCFVSLNIAVVEWNKASFPLQFSSIKGRNSGILAIQFVNLNGFLFRVSSTTSWILHLR
ncbi:hypothetical protein F2Q69_00043735 [Brassica cretica]|uniref:Glycosyltransferase 61 catalytic domain-containing protein n=1 Tax=Brassica cretica TaxID=69181 RepID=A0A8S9NJ42_BRACR|nr:hypothetical protein F2Q69_00043735 [Brassica cretica]